MKFTAFVLPLCASIALAASSALAADAASTKEPGQPAAAATPAPEAMKSGKFSADDVKTICEARTHGQAKRTEACIARNKDKVGKEMTPAESKQLNASQKKLSAMKNGGGRNAKTASKQAKQQGKK